MKRIAISICLGLMALLCEAQPRHPFPPERMSDDELIQMQTRDLVHWLGLDQKTEDKFIKEYMAFRKEIDAISKDAKPPQDMKDESEIDAAIQQNFSVSEQILQVRKKYYSVFKKFMKPSQIQMMYHLENEAGRRMQDGPGKHEGPGHHPVPPADGKAGQPRP